MGAKENESPTLKGTVFGSLDRNRLVSIMVSLEGQLSFLARPGQVLEPALQPFQLLRNQKPHGSHFLVTRKLVCYSIKVLAVFLLKILSQEKRRGILWRRAASSPSHVVRIRESSCELVYEV